MCAWGSRDVLGRSLQNEWTLGIVGRFCTDVFDAPFPLRAQKVKAKAVRLWVCFGEQARAESDPLGSIDQAFEDGILHPLPAIFAQASDLAKAFLAGLVASTHIVADEHEHVQLSLTPEEGGVPVETAANVTGEQKRLYIGHKAKREAFL